MNATANTHAHLVEASLAAVSHLNLRNDRLADARVLFVTIIQQQQSKQQTVD